LDLFRFESCREYLYEVPQVKGIAKNAILSKKDGNLVQEQCGDKGICFGNIFKRKRQWTCCAYK